MEAQGGEHPMAQFNPGSAQDMQLAVTVQQNLKMCAAAIGQMRQEAMSHRKMAEGIVSPARELREAKAENARLRRIHDATQYRLQNMQEQMDELKQLTALLIETRDAEMAGRAGG